MTLYEAMNPDFVVRLLSIMGLAIWVACGAFWTATTMVGWLDAVLPTILEAASGVQCMHATDPRPPTWHRFQRGLS